jgi:hypothetical protein
VLLPQPPPGAPALHAHEPARHAAAPLKVGIGTFSLFFFHKEAPNQPAALHRSTPQTTNHLHKLPPPSPSRYGVERGIAAAAHDLEAAHTRLALLHTAVVDERRPIAQVRPAVLPVAWRSCA